MTTPAPKPLPPLYGFGITVDNVNEALPLGLALIQEHGVERVSRGIPYIEVPGPVSTLYRTPQRRVLFDHVRDANPFFHLIESMWILSGSNGIDLPAHFLPGIARYSDNGLTFHGAYGHRLREAFGFDQLKTVVAMLKEKPDTRQAVLSIWHPERDLNISTKDMPCNDMVMFSIRDDYLHMTVCNRSNDAIWGAYGANAVQFSILQEWVAAAVGANVGFYTQQSNSFHIYPDNPYWQSFVRGEHASGHVINPYMSEDMVVTPLALSPQEAAAVLHDCEDLNERAVSGVGSHIFLGAGYQSDFFLRVVVPMMMVHKEYKEKKLHNALTTTRYIDAPDWRLACQQWLERRIARKELQ